MLFDHMFTGFASSIAGLAILSTVLFLYVIYDVIVTDEMLLIEKLIWIVLAATTGIIGIAVYLYLVKYEGELIADHTDLKSIQASFATDDIDRLERLSRLKEKGDLTEEEFEERKKDVLG